jgi:hypothetical protein
MYTCIKYTYSHREWGDKGDRGELTREKDRGAVLHKAGRNTNMTDQSINSIKHQKRRHLGFGACKVI